MENNNIDEFIDEPIYTQTTDGITVLVSPEYLQDQSDPDQNYYVWAYHVRIENNGLETLQLLSRYWKIIDLSGKIQEVRGEGVVGDQPTLKPGEAYEYSSGTPLATPSGFMSGSYTMANNSGLHFDAIIPPFSLDSPYDLGAVH